MVVQRLGVPITSYPPPATPILAQRRPLSGFLEVLVGPQVILWVVRDHLNYHSGSTTGPWTPLTSSPEVSVLFKVRSRITTVCPRGLDPFYTVTYYMKWVNTTWTHSSNAQKNFMTIFFTFYVATSRDDGNIVR